MPRISVPGYTRPFPLPLPPRPWDQLDATRLVERLRALGAVLDDWPAHARRFARWRSRAEERRRAVREGRLRSCRLGPLRPGRAPGTLVKAIRHRRRHEVHDLLDIMQGLAVRALAPADTS